MPVRYDRHKYPLLLAAFYTFFTIAAAPFPIFIYHHYDTDTVSPAQKKIKSKANISKPGEEVFTFVEVYPYFPGGEDSLQTYLRKNIRLPEAAARAGISENILVKFIVDRTGILKDIHVAGTPKGYGLEEEALRVVTNMPKWKPANFSGRHVSVYDSLLIHFTPVANRNIAVKEDAFICGLEEEMPSFPGGEEQLVKYLEKNIKYPTAALKASISGTVFIQFTIGPTGIIHNVHPVGASPKGYGLEAEAIRVVKSMPKWKPARRDGKAVEVLFNLPVRFTLTEPIDRHKKISPRYTPLVH
ncbi:MAG: TonB family protein [Chitinophaga sp.]|uniref:energy transducer TonB n=1 Tax=Chitinophaga sp. TaxID=1869181 RepID=UPI001B040D68|nr:energy transducer TonB [Chitinophaga sp.]MBO9727586.1 TonB family protein [Chitinophaga sp.]